MNLDKYKAIFCDLDGCLISGDKPLPGSIELINQCHNRLWIISNNSTDTPKELKLKLSTLGINLSEDRIILAGTTAINLIAQEHPNRTLKIYGSASLQQYATDKGLKICNQKPEIVLITRDISFNYNSLVEVINQVMDKAKIYITNPDLTHPGLNERPVPETGSLLQWVKSCVPELEFEVVGKPEIKLFESGLRLSGKSIKDSLFIGDNEATDGLGAKRIGMDFYHVKNGINEKGLIDLLEAQ